MWTGGCLDLGMVVARGFVCGYWCCCVVVLYFAVWFGGGAAFRVVWRGFLFAMDAWVGQVCVCDVGLVGMSFQVCLVLWRWIALVPYGRFGLCGVFFDPYRGKPFRMGI